MITVITTYPLLEPMTPEEARRNFLSNAPRYQAVGASSASITICHKTGRRSAGSISGTPALKPSRCSTRAGAPSCETNTAPIPRSCTLIAPSWSTISRAKFSPTISRTRDRRERAENAGRALARPNRMFPSS